MRNVSIPIDVIIIRMYLSGSNGGALYVFTVQFRILPVEANLMSRTGSMDVYIQVPIKIYTCVIFDKGYE